MADDNAVITRTKRTPDRPLALVGTDSASPPTPRRFRLNTMRGIRREMTAVYREARTGKLDVGEACKYGFLLATLGKLSEAELLEARIEALEELDNDT